MTLCVSWNLRWEGTLYDLWGENSESERNKKQRISPLLFPACTLPQALCQIQTYWSGDSVPAQVPRLAEFERTTASAIEQNERTPVWFTFTGFAHAE